MQSSQKNYYEKLPNNWITCKLKHVLDVRDGTHDSPKYLTSGYPFISSKNLKNGTIDYKNIKFISKADFDKYNIRSNAENNDILFGMIGTIGNPAIISNPPFKFAFKNMALIKTIDNQMSIKYVFYYIKNIEDQFRKESAGGVQQFISLDYIRNSIIMVPPLDEQIRISERVNDIFNLIDS